MGHQVTSKGSTASAGAPPSGAGPEHWPAVHRVLAGLIGEELTVRLVSKRGGLGDAYIPVDVSRQHPWREIVGERAWARIVQHYAGQRVHLSKGARHSLTKVRMVELADEGLSWLQIAMRLRVTERYVRRMLTMMGRTNPGTPRHAQRPRGPRRASPSSSSS